MVQRVFRVSGFLCFMYICYEYSIYVSNIRTMGMVQCVFWVSGFLCCMYICYEYSMYGSHIRTMGMVQCVLWVSGILCCMYICYEYSIYVSLISVSWVWYNVFFVFRDSCVLCIYVMNILYTFHSYPYHGYGTTCFSCFGIPMFYVYML